MKFINVDYPVTKSELIERLSDNGFVNAGVNFDEKFGTPHMKIKEKGKKIKITCEMMGRSKRDNGFIVGTYFSGKITERDGGCTLKGVITTAPIYHLCLIILIGVFIYQCINLGGFSVVPIFVVLFDVFLFKDEFKKQGYIERYLYRAYKKIKREQK